jgi:hypothetical protein
VAIVPNFGERRKAEVQFRRIPLPRTSVNKDKKGGGHCLLPYEPHYAALNRITL